MPSISEISIRPGVSILTALPYLNYKPWFALAEFVDNALQSYLANQADIESAEGKGFVLQVDINLDPNLSAIAIRDNAAGISAKDFRRAFRTAEIPPDASGLSEFGMGMKSAACWFAPKWSVRTKALGEPEERTVTFDIPRIVKDGVEQLAVVSTSAPRDRHYTEIILCDVSKNFPRGRTLGKIKDHLASIYRCFTRDGMLKLHLSGEELKFEEPEILQAPYYKTPKGTPILWKKRVNLKLGSRRAEGFVAIREKGNTARAGLALFRRNRLVVGSADEAYRPPLIFGAPNSFTYQRLFGELHLTGFTVSHTKDGFQWDDIEEEFAQELRKILQGTDMPIIDQAYNYRAKGVQRDNRHHAQRALERLGEDIEQDNAQQLVHALDKIEREQGDAARAAAVEPPRVQLTAAPQDVHREINIHTNGQNWQVHIVLSYDESMKHWYDITDFAEDIKKVPRQLGVRLSMLHPFTERYCDGGQFQTEALLRVAVSLALAETLARDSGVKMAGVVRTNFNELLRLAFSGK